MQILVSLGRFLCDMIKKFAYYMVKDEKLLEDIFLLEDF